MNFFAWLFLAAADAASTATSALDHRSAWLVFSVASVCFGLEIALVWWGRKRLLSWLNGFATAGVQKLKSHRLRLLGMRQIMQLTRALVRLLSVGLVVVGFLLWLPFLPLLFPGLQSWTGQLEHAVVAELGVIGGAFVSALPGLAVIAVVIFVTRVLHEFSNHYFDSIEAGEHSSPFFDTVTAGMSRRLAGVLLWLCAIVISYPYIPGSDTPIFKGISILAGLMVSLGANNLVGQLVNGLVLIYTKTLRPGDYVKVADTEGTVERVSLFSCALRTPDEELVTLPNSVVSSHVRNFSRASEGSAVRFVSTVTIGYDAPWKQVHALLLAAAAAVPEIRRDPAPFVRQAALEDFYVRYELVFAPEEPRRRRLILSSLHAAIQDEFHAAGVQIMSPNYFEDPAEPKIPKPWSKT